MPQISPRSAPEATPVSLSARPASAQSLIGLRPTRGLVSRDGIIPLSTTQDAVGPITRTVEDAARMLDAMAGYDPRDPITAFSLGKIPESYTSSLDRRGSRGLEGARIGVLLDFFGTETVHEDVNAVTATAVARMEVLGTTTVEIRIPGLTELTRDLAVSRFEGKVAFNAYLAESRATVKTLSEFIRRGTFHEAIRESLEADERVADGLNDPEYRRRLRRRQTLRQAVMTVMGRSPAGCHPVSTPASFGRKDRRAPARAEWRPLEWNRFPRHHVSRGILDTHGGRAHRSSDRHRAARCCVE